VKPWQMRCVTPEKILDQEKKMRLQDEGASLACAFEHEIERSWNRRLRLCFAATRTPKSRDRTRVPCRALPPQNRACPGELVLVPDIVLVGQCHEIKLVGARIANQPDEILRRRTCGKGGRHDADSRIGGEFPHLCRSGIARAVITDYQPHVDALLIQDSFNLLDNPICAVVCGKQYQDPWSNHLISGDEPRDGRGSPVEYLEMN
jgi:hypothetical protein